jgi:hypothetical protein
MLKLPKHPKTRVQLRFVRYWLCQLSRAHFKYGEYQAELSPEFIGTVFPIDVGTQKNFCLSFGTLKVKKILEQKQG